MSDISIHDIEQDEQDRFILDTPDKIIKWIKYQYNQQELEHNRNPEISFQRYIDLSNCVICTRKTSDSPLSTNLYDLAGKIDCIVRSNHLPFHYEVLEELKCRNSIIYGIGFSSTRFHHKIEISDSTFKNGGSFNGCEFLEPVLIQDCDQCQVGSFERSVFHREIYLTDLSFNCIKVSFAQCTFKGNVNLSNILFPSCDNEVVKGHNFVDFSQSTFHHGLSLKAIRSQIPIFANECVFEGQVEMRNISSEAQISFANSSIRNRFSLTSGSKTHNRLTELNLRNVTMYDRCDIENSEIGSLYTDFASIMDKCLFRLCCCKVLTCCSMYSLYNQGFVIFDEDELSKINLDGAINIGVIELEDTRLESKNIYSEKTARILKESAQKIGNDIDALEYRKIELYFHKCQTKFLWDKIILFLNKISNDYGRSFVYGVVFTLVVAFVFFFVINYWGTDTQIFEFNMRGDFSGFGTVWKKYLDVLNVLNFRDQLKGVELNALGETMFLISKIFIAYGMYQTVIAFRKYHKNQ